jgi:hypothetical protein
MRYTLFSKDRISSYPNLTKFEIEKSPFLKDYLEFQPADNYEIDLDFSPETLFSIGQFLKHNFLDSMISNYGHLIQAFDFLRLNEYVKKYPFGFKKIKKSAIISPKALLEFLETEIDIPENFPTEYRNELFGLLKDWKKYFFTFLKLSPTNDEIQMIINSAFQQWDKINMDQFIKELYELRKLMLQKLESVEETFITLLTFIKGNSDETIDLYEMDQMYENEKFDQFVIKRWEFASKLFPTIYYYYALQIIEELEKISDEDDAEIELEVNTLLKSHAQSHIEYMENASKRKRVQSCISCGKMAQFKTDGKRPIFVCSRNCLNSNGLEM